MTKDNEVTLSWDNDLSYIALEGDCINKKSLGKALRQLHRMYDALTEDKHFYKDDNGADCYLAFYQLD